MLQLLDQLGLPRGHTDSLAALGLLREGGKEARGDQVDRICSLQPAAKQTEWKWVQRCPSPSHIHLNPSGALSSHKSLHLLGLFHFSRVSRSVAPLAAPGGFYRADPDPDPSHQAALAL